jgi:hypothetical protein
MSEADPTRKPADLDQETVEDVGWSLATDFLPVVGTPKQRYEEFMAGFDHLAADEIAYIRKLMRPEFGLGPEEADA